MQLARNFGTTALLTLSSILLVVLVIITYQDAPQNGFHLDDGRNIFRYPPVMVTELTAANVIEAGRNALLPARPLPSMTFAIDWARGGGTTAPFLWTNIALHAATAIAVFGLLYLVMGRLRYSRWISVTAALIGTAMWASHPIQTQAVTYIVQRMTAMAALFTILTVILYVLGRQSTVASRRWLFFGLGALSWALALASKETAAIAPFLLLLVEYGVLRHGKTLVRNRVDLVLLSLPAVLALLVVIDIASGVGPLSNAFLSGYENRDFTLEERLLTQPRVIGLYLSQVIWPLAGRFSLEHDFALSTGLLAPPETLFALLGVIVWCAIGLRMLFQQSNRIIGFFMLWVPATLVIESSFIALEMVFEHRMYLPSVGLAGLAVIAVSSMLNYLPRITPLILAVCCGIIALLMISTHQYVPVWRDAESLGQNSVRHAPNSSRAWASYAVALRERGDGWNTVEPALSQALKLDPAQAMALNLRALQLIESKRLVEAEQILKEIAPSAATDFSVLNTLGLLRFEQGNLAEAVRFFKRAVELNQAESVFIYNLALSLELNGQCNDAYRQWLAYMQVTSDQQRLVAVRDRIKRNYLSKGGRCFGTAQ